jgi:putative hydrolase of HD superfamily
MDNLQPLLLNHSNGGSDWREHGVSIEQVRGRQEKTKLGSEALYDITNQIMEENLKKGNLKP